MYAVALVAVFLAGLARLTLTSPGPGVVRVRRSAPRGRPSRPPARLLTAPTVDALESGTATRGAASRRTHRLHDSGRRPPRRHRQQAQAGAQVVAWPEASAVGAGVLEEDRTAFLQRAVALARQHHIYLELGLGVFLTRLGPAALPEGRVGTDRPRGPRPVDATRRPIWSRSANRAASSLGEGRLPISDTAFGRMAGAICFDQDFPGTMRQAGRAGADIVIGPSNDWRAIDPGHADAATFRAVENGYSLLRPASNGLSLAVDYRGRVLGAADYFTASDRQILTAKLPIHGVQTIYSRIGDVFAWLCLAGLALLLAASRPRGAVPDEKR